jgi:hypothetical protein
MPLLSHLSLKNFFSVAQDIPCNLPATTIPQVVGSTRHLSPPAMQFLAR